MRPVQKFSKEYLEACKTMKTDQIARFLEDFRLIHARAEGISMRVQTRLISMKVEVDLLEAFKTQCKLLNIPYQTQIKRIMGEWLTERKWRSSY